MLYQASVQDTPYLNDGRHPRLRSDLALKARFPEEASSTGDASVPAKRTGIRRKTVGGIKAVKDPRAVDFIGNIEKAVAKAKVCLQAAQQRQKKYADQHRLDVHYDVGQLVWLSSQNVTLKAVGSRKLLPRWLGPFKVLAKSSPANYTLEIPAHYHIHPSFQYAAPRLRQRCWCAETSYHHDRRSGRI